MTTNFSITQKASIKVNNRRHIPKNTATPNSFTITNTPTKHTNAMYLKNMRFLYHLHEVQDPLFLWQNSGFTTNSKRSKYFKAQNTNSSVTNSQNPIHCILLTNTPNQHTLVPTETLSTSHSPACISISPWLQVHLH